MSDDQSSVQSDYRSSHFYSSKSGDGALATAPFDAHMAELKSANVGEIIPTLFPVAIPRCLDVACGGAHIAQSAAPLAKPAIGVAISASMVETARKKCPKVEPIHSGLPQAAQEMGQFDVATSYRSYGNAQPALRHEVLQELARLVSPRGYLIVNNHRTSHSKAALLQRATSGKMKMDRTQFRRHRIHAEHGFKILDSRPIGAWLFGSSMMVKLGRPDKTIFAREKRFGHRMLSAIAPDTILVPQHVA